MNIFGEMDFIMMQQYGKKGFLCIMIKIKYLDFMSRNYVMEIKRNNETKRKNIQMVREN
jgi:hypothetical protein